MSDTVTITLDREDAELLAVADPPASGSEAKAYGEADARLVTALRTALDTPAPEQSLVSSGPLLDDDGPLLLAVREAVASELEACEYRGSDGDPLFADGCEWIANEISDAVKKELRGQLIEAVPSGLSDEDRERLGRIADELGMAAVLSPERKRTEDAAFLRKLAEHPSKGDQLRDLCEKLTVLHNGTAPNRGVHYQDGWRNGVADAKALIEAARGRA